MLACLALLFELHLYVPQVGEVYGDSHNLEGDPACNTLLPENLGRGMFKNIDCSSSWGGGNIGDRVPPLSGGSTNLFSEFYAYLPPGNTDGKSFLLFVQDTYSLPGFGPHRVFDPPHYPWLVAVDPRGGVLLGGKSAQFELVFIFFVVLSLISCVSILYL